MNGYLADTNVLSELTKPAPEPRVEGFLRRVKYGLFMSVLTIGEIRKGIFLLPSSNRRESLEEWLDNEITPWFANRVLPVTIEVAEHWGRLAAEMKGKGKPRPVVDAILAATAGVHELILVTRNIGDYEGLGVVTLNPWLSL